MLHRELFPDNYVTHGCVERYNAETFTWDIKCHSPGPNENEVIRIARIDEGHLRTMTYIFEWSDPEEESNPTRSTSPNGLETLDQSAESSEGQGPAPQPAPDNVSAETDQTSSLPSETSEEHRYP